MAVVLVLIHCQFYFYKKTFFCSSVVNNWEILYINKILNPFSFNVLSLIVVM